MRKFIPAALAVAAVAALSTGGAAVAGGLIGGKDIKDDSVRSVDLHDGTVKVRDLNPVALRKITASATGAKGDAGAPGKNGADGADGLLGPQGDAGAPGKNGADGADGLPGPQGESGENGKDGVSGYEVRSWDYALVSGGGWADMGCTKDSGKVPLGGGYQWKDEAVAMEKGLSVVTSMPGRMNWSTNTPDATKPGWIIRPNKPANVNPGALSVYVICASMN